ncbi:MAG: T9SS type A sorting domain-containing protein [Tannerella sp.]|nr:T9SS type A sorting domain-containing protein [Tannerella sp.]
MRVEKQAVRGWAGFFNWRKTASGLLFLTVVGETAGETLRFKVYDENGQTVDVTQTLPFTADAVEGTIASPYVIQLQTKKTTDVHIADAPDVSVYPNPASTEICISHPFATIDYLELSDAVGKIIRKESNFTDEKLDVSKLPGGVYLLKIVHNGKSLVLRVVKE